MRRNSRLTILGLALAFVALPALAQQVDRTEVDRAFRELDRESRLVVERYLKTDCELGEEGRNLQAVLEIADRVRPYLVAVERQGPPSVVVEELDGDLEQAWQARQRFLKTPEAQELGDESFQMMQAISREDYFRDQRQALEAKYRERAALALRRIEGAE
jgi:hypothetical protein